MATPVSGSSASQSKSDDISVATDDLERGVGPKSYPMVNMGNDGARDVGHNTRPSGSGSSSSSELSGVRGRAEFERLPLFAQKATRRAQHVSKPVTGILGKVWRWMKGPEPPKKYKMTRDGFLGNIQYYPVRMLNKIFPGRRRKFCLLMAYYILWAALFIHILVEAEKPRQAGRYGAPTTLSCVSRVWTASCGVNGDLCRPFDDYTWLFRCPSGCLDTQVLNPYTIGNERINYRPLVIGGPVDDPDRFAYRGDSFICGAAIHAGIITDAAGGLGLYSVTGDKHDYPASDRNGISSVGFNSSFPLSFTFLNDTDLGHYADGGASDPQWRLLALSVTFTTVLSLFTTSAPVFFASVFTAGFWQIGLASNPPDATNFDSRVSTILSRFLPACFMMTVMYFVAIKKTLTGLELQIEKTVLWIGAFWVGALARYTTERIPIQRLTPRDIRAQPGGLIALIIIVLIIFIAALLQAWFFRNEGRLPRYLALYLTLGISLCLLIAVPNQNLRIHHYILGLLLLPGTSLQSRPGLLFQGLLVGLFIDGAARWGFASILETTAALRGDADLGSLLPILASAPLIAGNNITFTWNPPEGGYDGVSVLVNDVERFRGFHQDGVDSFSWTRHREGEPEFFRFGYLNFNRPSGLSVADYTRAATWNADGSYGKMEDGAS